MKAYTMENIILVLTLIMQISLSAQSIEGIWQTVDDEDGQPKSHIEIYQEDGKIYAKVIKLITSELTHCEKCKGDLKDAPIIGLRVLKDMVQEDENWSGGYILDPKNGKEYRCNIGFEDDNTLKVRGYIGTPLLGRTQYWYRVGT